MAAQTRWDSEQADEPEDDWALVRGTRLARHKRGPAYRRPLLVILAVTALAGGLRFYHLSSPHGFVFDEVYYAKDACLDAGFDYRNCQLETPNEQTATVHPPLGRWIIAGGIKAFSKPSDFGCTFGTNKPARCHPFGFRVMPATFGTLFVVQSVRPGSTRSGEKAR